MSDISDNDFTLTDGERHSPVWVRLSAHLNTRLAQLRGKNDGTMPPDETAKIRGQISTLKEVIALGDEPPKLDG